MPTENNAVDTPPVILIAEPRRIMCLYLESLVKEDGRYHPVLSTRVDVALGLIRRLRPVALITAHNFMPSGEEGLSLIMALQANSSGARVLIYTDNPNDRELVRLQRASPDDVVIVDRNSPEVSSMVREDRGPIHAFIAEQR